MFLAMCFSAVSTAFHVFRYKRLWGIVVTMAAQTRKFVNVITRKNLVHLLKVLDKFKSQ